MNSKRFLKHLLRHSWLPNSIKFHRSEYWSYIQYWKSVLETWISGIKSYHLRFPDFTVLHGQIIIWIWKLPSKTAKLLSKMPIAMPTSWLNCRVFGKKNPNVIANIMISETQLGYCVRIEEYTTCTYSISWHYREHYE